MKKNILFVVNLIIAISLFTINVHAKDITVSIDSDELISGNLTEPSSLSCEDVVLNYLNSEPSSNFFINEEVDIIDTLFSSLTSSKVSVNNKSLNSNKIGYKIVSEKKIIPNSSVLEIEQNYEGVPIYGSKQKALLSNKGVLKSISGKSVKKLIKKPGLMNFSNITKKEAIKYAKDSIGIKSINPEKTEIKRIAYIENEKPVSSYLVNLAYINPTPANWNVIIDASTGKSLKKYNTSADEFSITSDKTNNIDFGLDTINELESFVSDLKPKSIKNSGTGLYTGECSFMASKFLGKNYLIDQTRGKGIWTINGKKLFFENDSDGSWTLPEQSLSVDTHYNFELIYDYYKNKFNRNSYDNNGALIKNITTLPADNKNNAFYLSALNLFIFLEGDGELFNHFTSLDVVAHEFAHGVTRSESNLIYMDESGAINEAYSDIFATLIEFECDKNPDWLIGEDVYTPSIEGDSFRSMSDPTICGQPDHVKDQYKDTDDNGGVHINNGIINKVAYLIAEGGTHYDVEVVGIGKEKLGKIFYDAQIKYLVETTDFKGLKTYIIQSATDLYGGGSQEVKSVTDSFNSVGITN
ncbi:MAG: M4 family metallopeptidase [Clostridiales bacterium]